MPDDTTAPFLFPPVSREKVIADFDGKRITFGGAVMLLVAAVRRLGIAQQLAPSIADPRNPLLVTTWPPTSCRLHVGVFTAVYAMQSERSGS